MSAVDVLLQLEAAHDGMARNRTALRHRHIAEAPMVVVAYRLAGEAAAPLGILYGTSPDLSRLLVAPEPRARELRFREVFNPFSADLCKYVEKCAATRVRTAKGRETCEAPQLITPNGATADFVGSLIGRSLRYLRTDGEFAVPATTVEAGAHLTWLGTRAEHPGSSVLTGATHLLRRHWVSGMSDLESEDLFVQLGWIDPPRGSRGIDAARDAEERRIAGSLNSAGPASDPVWDRDVLDPLISEFNERRARADDKRTVLRLGSKVKSAVEEALRPAWNATWKAIDLVRTLPVAGSVAKRWDDDREDFSRHVDRVETGQARFRVRDSVKQAAFTINRREQAQSELDAEEAFDDPLVMAGHLAEGRAIAGTVTKVDRPFVTLDLPAACPLPVGHELSWSEARGKCTVAIHEVKGRNRRSVVLETLKGKTKYYPEIGDRAVYGEFATSVPFAPLPAQVPWTHIGAQESAIPAEVPD